MKSIGAETLFVSVLILLSALSNDVSGEDGNQTTALQTTSAGVLNTTPDLPTSVPAVIINKTENGSTATPPAMLPTARPSDVAKTNVIQDITDNQAKNESEATTKLSNITDQYHPANTFGTVLPDANLTILSSTHATLNHIEITSADEKTDVDTTDDWNNFSESESSDKTPTELKGTRKDSVKEQEGEEKTAPLKSRKGIVIGVGCVVAAVVFVVFIFLYKMCQKKPPVAGNSEIKVSAQTKESVKLLSVKSATPYSDSKRMSPNHMESIEC